MSICTVTRTWADGVVDSYDTEWPQYTAAEACLTRLHSLRWAQRTITHRDATSLTYTGAAGGEIVSEHLAWRDTKETP